jgi:hypothetical protein
VITGQHHHQLHPQDHPLWADLVPESEYNEIPTKERKRQEAIYELIYTETNYIKDLEYLDEVKYHCWCICVMVTERHPSLSL